LYANISEHSVPSSYLPAYEDGRDGVFQNVGIQNSDTGELPRRKHTSSLKPIARAMYVALWLSQIDVWMSV
jgi:hypothetical protein